MSQRRPTKPLLPQSEYAFFVYAGLGALMFGLMFAAAFIWMKVPQIKNTRVATWILGLFLVIIGWPKAKGMVRDHADALKRRQLEESWSDLHWAVAECHPTP